MPSRRISCVDRDDLVPCLVTTSPSTVTLPCADHFLRLSSGRKSASGKVFLQTERLFTHRS